jgi:hypothetical protein
MQMSGAVRYRSKGTQCSGIVLRCRNADAGSIGLDADVQLCLSVIRYAVITINIRLGLSIPSVFLPICLSILVECFLIGTQSNDQTVETSGLEREGAIEGKGLERDKLDGEGLKGFVCSNLPSLTRCFRIRMRPGKYLGGEGGAAGSQIVRLRESLVLYEWFNTLCLFLWSLKDHSPQQKMFISSCPL